MSTRKQAKKHYVEPPRLHGQPHRPELLAALPRGRLRKASPTQQQQTATPASGTSPSSTRQATMRGESGRKRFGDQFVDQRDDRHVRRKPAAAPRTPAAAGSGPARPLPRHSPARSSADEDSRADRDPRRSCVVRRTKKRQDVPLCVLKGHPSGVGLFR